MRKNPELFPINIIGTNVMLIICQRKLIGNVSSMNLWKYLSRHNHWYKMTGIQICVKVWKFPTGDYIL